MEYVIKIIESSKMSTREINDFIMVQREVFPKANMQFEDFKLKFLDNIFGDSFIALAYSDDVPAGARAFWRNDINGKKAYQPSDTAVRKDFRRQGLFVKMTIPILDKLTEGEIVYNFPNENSYPQYMKLGWKDFKIQYTRLFTISSYRREEPNSIPNDYFIWWIKPHLTEQYGYVNIFDNYFLVRRISNKGKYIVFGQLEKECALDLPLEHPILMVYQSAHCPIYNLRGKIACKIVYKCDTKPQSIPSWKTDVF